ETAGRDAGATWDRAIASIAVVGVQRTTVVAPVTGPTPSAPPPPNSTPVAPVVVRQEARPPPTTVVVVPPPQQVIVQQRMDPRMAELIVQRAYRDVLDRAPDADGLRTYRDRILRDGWSEQQVIEQLQRSSEARSIKPDEAIAKAY